MTALDSMLVMERGASTEPLLPRLGRLSIGWWQILLVGFVFWLSAVAFTTFSRSDFLVPTVVMLGSFLVPLSFGAWAVQRPAGLSLALVTRALITGATLGMVAGTLLEGLLPASPYSYLTVGLVEEAAKGGALLLVARQLVNRTLGDGFVLGAAVGAGFAALDTTAYALGTMLSPVAPDGGTAYVGAELARGVMAPISQGMCTAILGGVLFTASRSQLDEVWWTYLGVAGLHAFWDASSGLLVPVVTILDGAAPVLLDYLPRVPASQLLLYGGLQWVGLLLVVVAGVVWMGTLARRADNAERRRRRAAQILGQELYDETVAIDHHR